MSYCRMSRDSDLYMYGTKIDYVRCIVCCSCPLGDEEAEYPGLRTVRETVLHIQRHRDAGQLVPEGLESSVRDGWLPEE